MISNKDSIMYKLLERFIGFNQDNIPNLNWSNNITITIANTDQLILDHNKPYLNQLIPFFYETLKLRKRINARMIKDQIIDQAIKNEINEKNLLTLLLNSQSPQNLTYIGTLLKAANCPIPVAFPKILINGDITHTIAPEILYQVVSDQQFPLIVTLGFEPKIGKTTLFKKILPFDNNYTFTRSNLLSQFPSIDIYPGVSKPREYLICDIHGYVSCTQYPELFALTKKFVESAALVFLHITSKTIQKLNNIAEIWEILQISPPNTKVIILLRDSNTKKEELNILKSVIESKGYSIFQYFHVPNLLELKSPEEDDEDQEIQEAFEKTSKQLRKIINDIKSEPNNTCNFSKLLWNRNQEDKIFDLALKSDFEIKDGNLFNIMEILLPISYYAMQQDKIKMERISQKPSSFKISKEAINRILYSGWIGSNNQTMQFKFECKDADELAQKIHDPNEKFNYFLHENILDYLMDICLINSYSGLFKKFCEVIMTESHENLYKLLFSLEQLKKLYINNLEELKTKYQQMHHITLDQNQRDNIFKILANLKDLMEYANINLDKLWSEYFIRFDKMYKLDHPLKYDMKSVYKKWIENGNPINIIRGIDLKISKYFLDQIMHECERNNQTYVISIIGPQSTGKSTLMNALFGTNFETSAGRCTKGMYGSLIKSPELNKSNLLILDTEGLMSIEGRDFLFNHQMATFSFAASHIIMFNIRGEITTDSLKLIKIVIYALSNIRQKQKPKIIFILRDINRDENDKPKNIAIQIGKSIQEMSKELNQDFSKIFEINFGDFISLTYPFKDITFDNQETITVPSPEFSKNIIALRKKIFGYICNDLIDNQMINDNNNKPQPYKNLGAFYETAKGVWKTIRKFGKSILDMESVEHIVIDKKLAKIYDSVSTFYTQKLTKKANELFEPYEKEIKISETIPICIQELYESIINDAQIEFNKKADEELIHSQIEIKTYRIMYINRLIFECERIWSIINESLKIRLFEIKQRSYMKNIEENIKHKYFESLEKGRELSKDEHINRLMEAKNIIQAEFNQRFPNKMTRYEEIKALVIKMYNLAIKKGFAHNDNRILLSELSLERDWFHDIENFRNETYFDTFLLIESIKSNIGEANQARIRERILELRNVLLDIKELTESIINEEFRPNQKTIDFFFLVNIINNIFDNFDALAYEYQHMIKVNDFLNMLAIYILDIIVWKLYDNELSYKIEFQTKLDTLVDKIKEEVINFLNCAHNSYNLAELIVQKIFERKKEELLDKITHSKTNDMIDIFTTKNHTPKEYLNRAWESSFKKGDSEAILKYCINIKEYIKEIYSNEINRSLDDLLIKMPKFIKRELKGILDTLRTVWIEFKPPIIKENQKFRLRDCSLFMNEEGLDNEYYMKSFDNVFQDKIKKLYDSISILANGPEINSIKNSILKHMKTLEPNYIGCTKKCPTCGNKCNQLATPGHDHQTKHIFGAFHGISQAKNRRRFARIVYCLSKKNYNVPVYDYGQSIDEIPKFQNLMSFISTRHPRWKHEFHEYERDPNDNNNKFPKNKNTQEHIAKECWMKVRLPLSKYYNFTLGNLPKSLVKYSYAAKNALPENYPIPYQNLRSSCIIRTYIQDALVKDNE